MSDFRKRRTGLEGLYARVIPDKRRDLSAHETLIDMQESLADSRKIQSCPECAAEMVFEEREDFIEYKGVRNSHVMLSWWCTQCDEAIFSGKPLVDREKAWVELKKKVDENE